MTRPAIYCLVSGSVNVTCVRCWLLADATDVIASTATGAPGSASRKMFLNSHFDCVDGKKSLHSSFILVFVWYIS